VTGGNVSLYNETLDAAGNPQPIYPTPVIGMVGLVPDITKICGQGWQAAGDLIYLLGLPITTSTPQVSLGGSEYLTTIHSLVTGKPPVVDFDIEHRVQAVTRESICQGWVNSAHDCGEGGLVVALAESCIAGKLGAEINLGVTSESLELRWDELLFGESASRILVSVNPEQQASWEAYLNEQLAGYWQQIGVVTEEKADLKVLTGDNLPIIEVKMSQMCEYWQNAIARRLRV
jgi:phosphoribosylformylglycinamidine synthase